MFADVGPEAYNLDSDAVKSVVTEEDVNAIVEVHLYGLPAMDRLTDIADRYDRRGIWTNRPSRSSNTGGFSS
jgi:dTDP-4-amino-4,6-dideoxygalactose transaminase